MARPANRDILPRHGGDFAHATALYGEPAVGWLDLSTGVNPDPYPAPPIAAADLDRLPGGDRLGDLIEIGRRTYALPAGVALIASPGSELAVRLLPLVAPEGQVAVIGPTYPSHDEAWRTAGRQVAHIASIDRVPDTAVVVVLVNPNNPDGRLARRDSLVALAARLAARGGLLVVDEAFADLTPTASLMPRLAGLPALVLRSLGKFYGLPGLRLGFVAGALPFIDRLAALLGDWPVSGPALTVGRAALADVGWRDRTRERLHAQATELRRLLARRGLKASGGTDLFVLVDDPHAATIHRGLAERGIWTRAFAEVPSWLRLGLPKDDTSRARLDRALGEIGVLKVRRPATAVPPPGRPEPRRSRR
ncbi:MAG: threonine-phosphate decarboxylase CobD [Bauldia sp.]